MLPEVLKTESVEKGDSFLPISFIHCSDLHLGYDQYGQEERFLDFGRSFSHIVDYALAHEVNYVVVAGDMFNKRSINSRTLAQAMSLLDKLRAAQIPVIAIEGNHDKAPYGEQDSWMWFLNQQGYLHLLQPGFDDGCLVVTPWDEASRRGTSLGFPGIRFIGLGYQGSMMPRRLGELSAQLEQAPEYTVLLLHSAIQKMMHLGGIGREDIAPLRKRVDYVAMGHIHRRYEEDNWIYNPGSPECWDLGESQGEKGFYHVVCTTREEPAEVTFVPSQRRPVYTTSVDAGGCQTLEEVYSRCRTKISALNIPSDCRALVRLTLTGALPFNPLAVDTGLIEQEVHDLASCLVAEIQNDCFLDQEGLHGQDTAGSVSREQLERTVLDRLFRQEPGMQKWAEDLVDLALAVKDLTASEPDDHHLAAAIERLAERLVLAAGHSEGEPALAIQEIAAATLETPQEGKP